ncbi:MAG: type II secretion system protein [Candidatus Omnitrophica bacterium]|nr:type II secretion system protein [Candidatus Omnitrophota bacterium]
MFKHRGMTLVEVLMAVALLGIGAAFLLQSFATVSRALDVAQTQTDAYGFSVSKMEELQAAWRAGHTPDMEGSFQIHNKRFLWQAEAAAHEPEAVFSPLSTLTLRVQWNQRGAQALEWRTFVKTPEAAE